MKNVAIIGGSFNPPTSGHEAIARACLAIPEFDEVWLMPSGDRWDKQQSVEDRHRLGMLVLVASQSGDERLKVSTFELDLPRPSQTMRTVGELAVRHADVSATFVFGVDSYWHMPRWSNGNDLQSNLRMLLVPRVGYEQPVASNVTTLNIGPRYLAVSSSQVRGRVAAGESIAGITSKPVREYIAEHGLYGYNNVHAAD